MKLRLGFTAAMIALLASAGSAQPVYKSVNADGSISYGDKPTNRAEHIEEIEIFPGPSVDAVLDAMFTTEKIKQAGARMEAERLAREQARALERELQAALETEQQERERATVAAAAAAEMARLAKLEKDHRRQKDKKKKDKKNNHPPPLDVPTPWQPASPPAINMAPGTPLLNLPGPGE